MKRNDIQQVVKLLEMHDDLQLMWEDASRRLKVDPDSCVVLSILGYGWKPGGKTPYLTLKTVMPAIVQHLYEQIEECKSKLQQLGVEDAQIQTHVEWNGPIRAGS